MQPAGSTSNQSSGVDQATSRCFIKPQATARYVVELTASSAHIRPADVPHLDIFDLYHLYWDVRLEHGVVRRALRLGFFNEARTAKTIACYLSSHFASPRVRQIDSTEEARAGRHRFVALKDVGASGRYAAIELTAPPALPLQSPAQSVAVRSVPTKRKAATPSLWWRLIGPLCR